PHRLFRDFYSSLRRHWRFRQRGLLATRKNDYFRLQLSNLCFGGFVKAHTCRRGEVQRFRLPAHWDTHADISEVQPVPEPVRFVAEEPRGGLGEHAIGGVGRLVEGDVPVRCGGEDLELRLVELLDHLHHRGVARDREIEQASRGGAHRLATL